MAAEPPPLTPGEVVLRTRLEATEDALRALLARLAVLEAERAELAQALRDANRQVSILEGSLTFRLARGPRALYRLLRVRRGAP